MTKKMAQWTSWAISCKEGTDEKDIIKIKMLKK